MKYKILISGKNNTIIDDFFSQMSDDFEAVTTSNRYDDMIRHLSFYKPDVFVYCISGESRDNINQLINAKFRMMETRIPIVLIGAKEECDEVERIAINLFDLTLYRPISIPAITARISKLLEGRPRMEAQKPSFEPEAIPPGIFASKSLSPSVAAQLGGAMANRGRKHVLVVDDNSMMLKLIKEYLHETYDVATAVSGKIAMKFLERRMTNLILLDYEMPGENGPAVLEQLRANEATKDTRWSF